MAGPEPGLGEYHRLLQALSEAREEVLRERQIPLARVDEIARAHQVEPTSLLVELRASSDCEIDLAKGLIACR